MESIRRFVDGLTYHLRLLVTRERVFGFTFDEVVDIDRQIEMVHSQERGEGEFKRPRGPGDFSGVPSGGQFYRGWGRPYRHAQTVHLVHCGASSIHGSYSSHQGQSSLTALLAQSTSGAPSVHGSSLPSSSGTYSTSRGPPKNLPAFSERGCFECGYLGHIKRYCPHLMRGPIQQRSHVMTSTPVSPPPAQPARGGAQSVRGRPRGGNRSGGGQTQFYAFSSRPDVVASATMITRIVSVCHRESSILFDPGSTYSYVSSSVECLGHIVSSEGIKVDPKKVEAV
ncbi:uncharacterized protein [Nicotiana tomentosiformis]|uniref:uncharacterized protein n=1 Tax=Nicotiana tomentosiformis TaxID=4098 RepID=UPI00388C91FC